MCWPGAGEERRELDGRGREMERRVVFGTRFMVAAWTEVWEMLRWRMR